jgi:hypothetical protein
MTSLDGPGFSITLLKADAEMLACLDAPTTAVGWSPPSFAPEVWQNRTYDNLVVSEAIQRTDAIAEEEPKRTSLGN